MAASWNIIGFFCLRPRRLWETNIEEQEQRNLVRLRKGLSNGITRAVSCYQHRVLPPTHSITTSDRRQHSNDRHQQQHQQQPSPAPAAAAAAAARDDDDDDRNSLGRAVTGFFNWLAGPPSPCPHKTQQQQQQQQQHEQQQQQQQQQQQHEAGHHEEEPQRRHHQHEQHPQQHQQQQQQQHVHV
ncbi:hypothetical protein ACSSS7_008257 [Eimeria intestinalis]